MIVTMLQQSELITCSHTLRQCQQYSAVLHSKYGLQGEDIRAAAIRTMEVRLTNIRQAAKDKDSSG